MSETAKDNLERNRETALEWLEQITTIVKTYATDLPGGPNYAHAGTMARINGLLVNVINAAGNPTELYNKRTGEWVGTINPDGTVYNVYADRYKVCASDREWLRNHDNLQPEDIRAVGERVYGE